MKMVSLSEAKANLSRYVESAKQGTRVRILIREVPAADLVPIEAESQEKSSELDEYIKRLEKGGLIKRGRGRIPMLVLKPGPALKSKASAVESFLKERYSGR